MSRLFVGIVLLVPCLLVLVRPAVGQPSAAAVAPAAETAATTGSPETGPPAIPADALRDLIATIRDDEERERFVQRLETLLAAAEAAGASPEPAPTGPLAGFQAAVDARLAAVERAVEDIVRSFGQVNFLLTWVRFELGDPTRRETWLTLVRQLGGAILVGAALAFLFRLLALRTMRRAERRAGAGGQRILAAGLGFLVDVLAVSVFAAGLYVSLRLFGASTFVLQAATPVIVGALVGRIVAAVGKALLAPGAPERRLVPVDDGEARRLQRSLTALNLLLVYATAFLQFAHVLGLPWTIRGSLERLLYLAASILLVSLCFRYREPVAERLAARARSTGGLFARFLPWERLARSWHIAAALLVAAHYLVFALQIPGGLTFLFGATVATVSILVVARLAVMAIDAFFGRLLPAEAEEEPPGAGELVRRRYLRWTRALFRGFVVTVALLLVLEAWGGRPIDWLVEGEGRALLSGVLRLGIAFLLAVGVIELANAVARRYMQATTADGRPLYSSRTRTLASIVRNGVILLASLTFFLLFLSEIGVEAGPLLAGAGVVGLAIGFGSQKLVQDLITGLFILLGDTIRVGDVVDLGGKAGVVEAMSMRTVTLRGYDGHVHTIPYSSIDTVTNMTKDFSFWVAEVGIAYREDVDEVIRVLREIDEEMRREWPFRRIVLEPIEIAGLDRFDDSAVVVKARLKTRPGEQWRVGREFNRRVKKRFDELGIEIPFPHRTLYFGIDKNGTAPPAFVRMLAEDRAVEAGGVVPAAGER